MAVNYEISVPSGTANISGGRFLGDVGILLVGDSNMCGDGGGQDPVLDALTNDIFQWNNTINSIDQISTASTPYFNHTLNSGANEVGPDASFCDRFATERGANRLVVGLPAGDSGSGFSTNQWRDGEQMFDLAQELVNEFLAADPANTLGAILVVLGANDAGDFSPASLWRDEFDTMIQAFHGSAFNATAGMPSFAQVPIIVTGMAFNWYNGNTARQAIQGFIAATPTRELYTGYADSETLPSQVGDLIHLSGASNRIIGGTNAWTALLAAELNT